MPTVTSTLRVLAPVADALARGLPVVALETSVLSQGLPVPHNADAATRMVAAVEAGGAVAALTAVAAGRATLGLTAEELQRFLARDGVRKVSARDLAACMVQGGDGATTVAASLTLAHAGGIEVFATGGIGGVHRGAPFDESADLVALSRTPVICVCAGAKSILDLPATLERLESLGVPVIGYGTDELPGFFTTGTGLRVPQRADSAADIAAIARAHWGLGERSAILVVQPPPAHAALDAALVHDAVQGAVRDAEVAGVTGAGLTPFLLGAVLAATDGRSLPANLALLEANARLAAHIAVACAALPVRKRS
jgi:pseudouridine-5'-phosphate glycosidase